MSDTSAEGMNVLFRDLERKHGRPAAHTHAVSGRAWRRTPWAKIGNICMGTAATTMYTLIGRRVSITTPKVSVVSATESFKD